jgi:hypothetical protein
VVESYIVGRMTDEPHDGSKSVYPFFYQEPVSLCDCNIGADVELGCFVSVEKLEAVFSGSGLSIYNFHV